MTKKPRKKHYRPKPVSANKGLLRNLPISPDLAKKQTKHMVAALLRMRMTGKTVHDMTGCVIFFGIAWIASDRMNETEALRAIFEKAIVALETDLKSEGVLSPEAFEICSDAADLVYELLIRLTTTEYLELSDKLRDEGFLPLVDSALAAIEGKANNSSLPLGNAPDLSSPHF